MFCELDGRGNLEMPKSLQCFLWANEIGRASPSGVLPSQTGSIACDADLWWERWADCHAWPTRDRAWDARRNRSHQQRPARPSRFVLGFGGVFFQPTPKAGDSFVAGLNVAVHRTLQHEAQPPEPIACLTRFEFDVAFFAQELYHHHAIPAPSLQTKLFWRLPQCLLQPVLGYTIQSRRPARTRQVVKTLEALSVGFADPVDHSLTAQTKQATDSRRFPSRQKQQQPGDSNSYPSARNRIGHAQQRFGSHCRMRNFQRLHA